MQLKAIILIMSSVIYLFNASCLSWYLFDDDLEVYKQRPQLACLNYSSYLHISMLLPYILYFGQGEYFSSLFGFQNMYWKREKAGGCMYPYLCLPSSIPLPSHAIFLSVRSLILFFFYQAIRLAAVEPLVSQHQILWMTQKELGNFKSCFNTPLMAGEKLEVDSENLVAFKNKKKWTNIFPTLVFSITLVRSCLSLLRKHFSCT